MKMQKGNYTFRVIIEHDKKGTFHGFVPSLPGCHTWAITLEKAKENLGDALSLYLKSLEADGERIPQEIGLETFLTVPAYA